MYLLFMAVVCLCVGVSERKVHRAIGNGAASIDDVGRACGAGSRCGGCHETLDALLAEPRQRSPFAALARRSPVSSPALG